MPTPTEPNRTEPNRTEPNRTEPTSTGLTPIELAVGCNEASDLLPVHSAELLAAYDASHGFWTVLDEGPVEDCLALLLRHRSGEWWAHHVPIDAGAETGRTEDGEALAYADGWVYVVGSHFGSKSGPLRPRRAFFARFREDAVASAITGTAASGVGRPVAAASDAVRSDAVRSGAVRSGAVALHVVRNQFRLHRALNDALLAGSVRPLPPGERVHARFIAETLARGAAKTKGWAARLAHGDTPCNIEAAAFTPAGTLLLGLRFPVTESGQPILVEIAGVAGMFDTDPATWPAVVGTYVLGGVTPPGAFTGFRALSARPDGGYDAVIGSIDATGKGSVLLDDHPMGGEVLCRHVRFRLPETGTGPAVDSGPAAGSVVVGAVVHDLAPFHNVEGLAELAGARYYVTDEDHRVALWTTNP